MGRKSDSSFTVNLLASGSSSQRRVESDHLPIFVYEGFPEEFGCLEASASSLPNSVDLLLDASKYASAKPASLPSLPVNLLLTKVSTHELG